MHLVKALGLSFEIARSAWIEGHPFLLYFKPTARCDSRCRICNRWKEPGDPGEEIPLDEIRKFLVKFRRAGCAVFTLWGGEPLLRRDLPEILMEARRLGYRTSTCTNCNQLARKAEAIMPFLDVLLCSLDGYGDVHDELRGVKGLFDRVVKGIEAARGLNGSCDIKIWASIHRENLGQVEQMARLARDLSVGIEFFPVSMIRGYNDDILPGSEELKEAFGTILQLKRSGLPVRNPDRVLRQMQTSSPFTCNFARIAIHLDHRGRVYSCEDPEGNPLHLWSGHAEFDPPAVYNSRRFAEVRDKLKQCNRCRLPCVMDLSGNLARALSGMFFKTR